MVRRVNPLDRDVSGSSVQEYAVAAGALDSKMLQSSRYFFESVFALGGREGRGFSQVFVVDAIAEINAPNKARESIRSRLPPGPPPKTG